jgi:RNA polymerase sigma-70 factor, ECF subfamily
MRPDERSQEIPPPATADGESDSVLLEAVREGNVEAFGEIVRRYQRRALAIAHRLLRHREDAEDLVQEAFLVSLDKLDSFDLGRPFGPWFFRLLVNRGLNARRARAVRATDPLPDLPAADRENPLRHAEQAELRAQVAAAMDDLSDRQRLIVQLHELEGFTGPEIAEMLGMAPATVRWTLHMARKRLREALAPTQESGTDG